MTMGDGGGGFDPSGYDPNIAALAQDRNDIIREQIDRSYGLEQQKLSQAMQIARMQSGNSRAATAQAARQARAQLQLARDEMEKIGIPDMLTRRYVAEKNYEIAKLSAGVDIAQVSAQLRSTPDRYFLARDFEQAIPGLLSQQMSAPTEGPTEGPSPFSLEQLVAELSPGGQQAASAGGAMGGSDQSGGMPGSGQPGDATAQWQSKQINALQALLKNNPPSAGDGYNAQDQNMLNVLAAVFKQGLNPFVQDKLNPTQKGIQAGGGARLGYDVPTELWRAETRRPGQGNPLVAG